MKPALIGRRLVVDVALVATEGKYLFPSSSGKILEGPHEPLQYTKCPSPASSSPTVTKTRSGRTVSSPTSASSRTRVSSRPGRTATSERATKMVRGNPDRDEWRPGGRPPSLRELLDLQIHPPHGGPPSPGETDSGRHGHFPRGLPALSLAGDTLACQTPGSPPRRQGTGLLPRHKRESELAKIAKEILDIARNGSLVPAASGSATSSTGTQSPRPPPDPHPTRRLHRPRRRSLCSEIRPGRRRYRSHLRTSGDGRSGQDHAGLEARPGLAEPLSRRPALSGPQRSGPASTHCHSGHGARSPVLPSGGASAGERNRNGGPVPVGPPRETRASPDGQRGCRQKAGRP